MPEIIKKSISLRHRLVVAFKTRYSAPRLHPPAVLDEIPILKLPEPVPQAEQRVGVDVVKNEKRQGVLEFRVQDDPEQADGQLPRDNVEQEHEVQEDSVKFMIFE